MALIMKPFPVVQVHKSAAMTWAGTIIGDNFFGDEDGKRMLKKATEGDAYGGDYHYGPDNDDLTTFA